MLNKEMIIVGLKEYYDDLYKYYDEPYETLLTDEDELHDIAMTIEINSIPIEECDAMYNRMTAIINAEKDNIIEEINTYIRNEYLDDSWGYDLIVSDFI